jgi:hypothetical protein
MSRPAKAPFPGFIPPELATLQSSVPVGAAFVHGVKLDGYRLQPHIRGGKVTLYTRDLHPKVPSFIRRVCSGLSRSRIHPRRRVEFAGVNRDGGLPAGSRLMSAMGHLFPIAPCGLTSL